MFFIIKFTTISQQLFYLWKYQGIKRAIQVSTVIGLLVFILFIIPFGVEGVKLFINAPNFYAKVMAGRFADYPRDVSLGMAKFFSHKEGWLIYDLQRGFSAMLMVLGILAILFNPKWIDKKWLPIGFLKLILVFFCNFLQIPYGYLFGPSTFLSMIIVVGFVQQKIEWVNAVNVSNAVQKDVIGNIFRHRGMVMMLISVPILFYAAKQWRYMEKMNSPYQRSGLIVYEQKFDTTDTANYWSKSFISSFFPAHTGKYINRVGGNYPYSSTFRIPSKEIIEKNYKGIRFSAWVKTNQIQFQVSKMIITISQGEQTVFYREKNISPKILRDEVWRKHILAVEFPNSILKKAKNGENYTISAFISYFDKSNHIHVDDMSIEFF